MYIFSVNSRIIHSLMEVSKTIKLCSVMYIFSVNSRIIHSLMEVSKTIKFTPMTFLSDVL